MCNRFRKYVLKNTAFYPKHLVLKLAIQSDHAIVQLGDQIFEAFENHLNTLGVFIDFSKNL